MSVTTYTHEVFTKEGFAFSIHKDVDSAQKVADRIGGEVRPYVVRE